MSTPVSEENRKRRVIRMAIGLGVIAVAIYGGYIALFFANVPG